jgi:preprotein translocase subunit SecG
MTTVLLIIHLMIAAALVGVVLVQRSEGGALGIGGGGGGGFMTGRGAANFLTRVTAGLALAFFTTSILLTLLANQPAGTRSIFDAPKGTTAPAPADKSAPASAPASDPAAPAPRGGILDKLGPAEPTGPRVPQSK